MLIPPSFLASQAACSVSTTLSTSSFGPPEHHRSYSATQVKWCHALAKLPQRYRASGTSASQTDTGVTSHKLKSGKFVYDKVVEPAVTPLAGTAKRHIPCLIRMINLVQHEQTAQTWKLKDFHLSHVAFQAASNGPIQHFMIFSCHFVAFDCYRYSPETNYQILFQLGLVFNIFQIPNILTCLAKILANWGVFQ